MVIVPTTYGLPQQEYHFKLAEILLKKSKDLRFSECTKGDWKAYSVAKQGTFTQNFISFLNIDNEWQYINLEEWYAEIFVKDEKVTSGLLCRTCRQKTVILTSQYEPRKEEYYHHSSLCTHCGSKTYPTGMLSFILRHWDEDIEAMDMLDAIRNKNTDVPSEQIDIFEYLKSLEVENE